jgi:hypothetical protein
MPISIGLHLEILTHIWEANRTTDITVYRVRKYFSLYVVKDKGKVIPVVT